MSYLPERTEAFLGEHNQYFRVWGYIQPSEGPHGWQKCIADERLASVVVPAGMQTDSKQPDSL
jgi:hypothetical protein